MRLQRKRERHDSSRDVGRPSPESMQTHSEISELTTERPWPAPIQPNLTIGQPDNQYEREAERVADQVTRTPDAVSEVGPISQMTTPDVAASDQPTRGSAADHTTGDSVPEVVHGVLRSSGQSLDSETRAAMEPRFGHDFRNVRVHNDDRAATSASAIDARAYTVGRHIVFGANQYHPESAEGSRLLAHELTHVVQQSPEANRVDRMVEADNPSSGVIQRENGGTATAEPATDEATSEPSAWQHDNAIQDFVEDSAEEWRHNKDRFDLALRQFQRRMSMTDESEVVPDVTGAVVAHVTKQITSAALSKVETLLPGWGEVKGVMDAMVGELERAAAAQKGLALRNFLMTTDNIMSGYFEQQIRAIRGGREELREMIASITEPEIKQGMVDSFPNWLRAIQERVPSDEQYEAALYIEWVNQARGMLDGFTALGQIEIKFDADDPGKYDFESAVVRAPLSTKVASGLNFIMETEELSAPNILYLPIRKSVGLWCENIVGGKGYGWALMDENNNTIQEPVQPVAAERWWAMPWKPLEDITKVKG